MVFSLPRCAKENLADPATPGVEAAAPLQEAPGPGTLVTVGLEPGEPGPAVPANFMGLSYEMRDITNPAMFNARNRTLINLCNNLGPSVLRIGAKTVDNTYWSGRGRTAATPIDSITTTDVDRFSNFTRQLLGWKVIFGLNLGINDPERAAKEAVFVQRKLGGRLLNFELGNEPESYINSGIRPGNYNYDAYLRETEAYYSAIRREVPGSAFSGPGIVTLTNLLKLVARDQKHHLSELTVHHYHMGPASDTGMTIKRLLEDQGKLLKKKTEWKNIAASAGLPYRVTECNSVFGGGRQGVSNTFAASLWTADVLWIMAVNQCLGVHFHTGLRSAGWYAPFTETNGQVVARPAYYGMLFFKEGSRGAILPVKLAAKGLNIRAYATTTADGTVYVSLINKEADLPANVQVLAGMPVASVTTRRLTAPSLSSTEQVTFGGSSVAPDGTFRPSVTGRLAAADSSFTVHLPAASAVLAIVRPRPGTLTAGPFRQPPPARSNPISRPF